MMRLLRSWRDSLLLLAPQNLKLFALVTLKSTIETYKALARAWYLWLFPTLLLTYVFINRFRPYKYLPAELVIGALVSSLTIMICLATRPSVSQKNFDYFSKHRGSFFLYILSFSIFIFIVHMVKWQLSYSIFILDFVPLFIFFVLFFLDSDGSIKQLWYALVRAITMTIYNVPLLLICMLVTLLPTIFIVKNIQLQTWPEYVALLLYFLVIKILIINIWTNIYIKKLHEMPDLYFKQPT